MLNLIFGAALIITLAAIVGLAILTFNLADRYAQKSLDSLLDKSKQTNLRPTTPPPAVGPKQSKHPIAHGEEING